MLRLTRRFEYGLMALAALAGRPDERVSVRELGEELSVPRRLLAEVLKDLARAEVVESARGPQGGYRLAVAPDELTLGRVLAALEGGPVRVAGCSDAGGCEHLPHCGIQSGVQRVAERIHDVLERSTLAELIAPPAATAPPLSV